MLKNSASCCELLVNMTLLSRSVRPASLHRTLHQVTSGHLVTPPPRVFHHHPPNRKLSQLNTTTTAARLGWWVRRLASFIPMWPGRLSKGGIPTRPSELSHVSIHAWCIVSWLYLLSILCGTMGTSIHAELQLW